MASFYQATLAEFLSQTDDHILARLTTEYAKRGYTSMYTDVTLTWNEISSPSAPHSNTAWRPTRMLTPGVSS